MSLPAGGTAVESGAFPALALLCRESQVLAKIRNPEHSNSDRFC
jgi:hypothetical protein